MVETGLLLDRKTGTPRTALIPWFEPASELQARQLVNTGEPEQNFCSKGIYPSFKCSLAKILWLQQNQGKSLQDSIWLSAADYLAYQLSGVFATDPSLAGRTYAFDINRREWDSDWLHDFGITVDQFPQILPTGSVVGFVTPNAPNDLGLTSGIPVSICGHDHVCGALAATGGDPQFLFDSMGTAEALVGALPQQPLGTPEYRSGLTFGCHVIPGMNYWMGGLSSSGGSIEWLRSILASPALSYTELESFYASFTDGPGDLLYFPYLAGSGAPHSDSLARGAFIGLSAQHNRADLVKAVLEGTAFEIEVIRQAAQAITGNTLQYTVAAGGGAKNSTWLQIKADVSGFPIRISDNLETTLLGAAISAGAGCGIFADIREAYDAMTPEDSITFQPDSGRHEQYQRIYQNGYLTLQAPLRAYYRYRYEEKKYVTQSS
jgi:sugar (pentulose or hexulose) kinase